MLRGALSKKSDLIAFFDFLDKNTDEKFLGKPYYDPKSPVYGQKTQFKGYRPLKYGAYKTAMKKFAYNGKSVTMPTIFARMKLFRNGVAESSKPTQAGAKSVNYEKWELTPTHLLIFERFGADKNSIKAHNRNPQRYPITYNKRYKYDNACFLAWKAMGAKIDPLEASETDWLQVWGKDPKAPNQCSPLVKDAQTGLIAYGHTTGIRWAMRNSKDPHVRDLIISEDERFNTKGVKREKGQNKKKYFTEEQCFILPQALNKVDTLMLSYFGDLFGGRFSALNDLAPEKIDYDAHKLIVFERKVQHEVEKPIYEPETSFIRQYIMDMGIKEKEPLFGRSIAEYNTELKATKAFFAKTAFPLSWTPTTHTAFKHTCVTQMSLHGVRMDTISDYIGTDPNTLQEFYRGGSEENVNSEIGGIEKKHQAPTWRAFVIKLTNAYAKRYEELTGKHVVLPTVKTGVTA